MTATPLTEPQGQTPGYLQPRDTTPLGPKRLKWSHDAMIDYMVQNPGATQEEIGQTFGYSRSRVCIIMASDAFRERLAHRHHELCDPTIRATLEERFRAITDKSQELFLKRLNGPADNISNEVLLKAMGMGAKALEVGGFGRQAPVAPPTPDAGANLNNLAGRLVGLLRTARGETVDVEATEIIPDAQGHNPGSSGQVGPAGPAQG